MRVRTRILHMLKLITILVQLYGRAQSRAAWCSLVLNRTLGLPTGAEAGAPVVWLGAKTRIEYVG